MNNIENNAGTKAFILVFSKVITLLMSIITTMILARTLTLDEYGTYSELLTISSIGVSLFSLGLPNALNYFLPQYNNKIEKQKFIGFYYVIVTAISLLIMIVMIFANKQIAGYYGNQKLVIYSYFLLIIPWTKLIISSRSNMLVAEGQVAREVIYCILNGLSLVILSVLIMFADGTFDQYIMLYVIVECIFAILVHAEAFRISGKTVRVSIDTKKIIELLRYTIPLGLSTAISTISLDLDKLIIGWFMDESSVAIYANAGKELPFSLISTSFTAVFLPQIIMLVKNNKINPAISRWKNIMELNYIILTFCVGISIVFAPQIITLLYSEQYIAGVRIFRVYSLTLLTRITYWAMILNAFGKTAEILYNSIICLAVNTVLSILMFKYVGFIGPALATIISILVMSMLQIYRTTKLIHKNILEIIPFKQFLLPTIVTGISGLFVYILMEKLNIGIDKKSILTVVGIGVLWGLLYIAIFAKKILYLWKTLNKNTNVLGG